MKTYSLFDEDIYLTISYISSLTIKEIEDKLLHIKELLEFGEVIEYENFIKYLKIDTNLDLTNIFDNYKIKHYCCGDKELYLKHGLLSIKTLLERHIEPFTTLYNKQMGLPKEGFYNQNYEIIHKSRQLSLDKISAYLYVPTLDDYDQVGHYLETPEIFMHKEIKDEYEKLKYKKYEITVLVSLDKLELFSEKAEDNNYLLKLKLYEATVNDNFIPVEINSKVELTDDCFKEIVNNNHRLVYKE